MTLEAWLSSLGASDPQHAAIVGLLLLSRLLPLCALTPWLLPSGAGWLVMASASATLAVAMLPAALAHGPAQLPSGVALLVVLAREALVGAAFAFLARLPLEAMTMAGSLVDRARAGSLGAIDSRVLAPLYRWFGLVLFVACGGAELVLRVVADGLASVPVAVPLAWNDVRDITFTFASLSASAITLGLLLSMPVLLGGALVDVAQAVAQRWLAAWPPSLMWLPTRQVVALALVMLSLSFVASVLPDAYATSIAQAHVWIGRLTP